MATLRLLPAPFVVAVDAPTQLTKLLPGTDIYQADVKISRSGQLFERFQGIYFIERDGCASLYGLQLKSALSDPADNPEIAAQKAFIDLLRAQTAIDFEALGFMAEDDPSAAFACEAAVIAAFIHRRGVDRDIAVGFDFKEPRYQYLRFEGDPFGYKYRASIMPTFEALTGP